jgi:hypothetical protein
MLIKIGTFVEHSCWVYREEGIANLVWRSVGHMTSLGTLPTLPH